jgi:predicted transcriptional regulator
MRVLWDRGEGTVSDVMGSLRGPSIPAYNTVQTMLRILETKGYVRHRKAGRAFIFSPLLDRIAARRRALKTLVNRFFEGSSQLLLLNLLEDEQLSEDTLVQIKQRLGEG